MTWSAKLIDEGQILQPKIRGTPPLLLDKARPVSNIRHHRARFISQFQVAFHRLVMQPGNLFNGFGTAIAFFLCLYACGCSSDRPVARSSSTAQSGVSYELRLGTQRIKFDPKADDDLRQLGEEVTGALGQLKKQPKAANAALQAAAKKYKRGLQEIQRLAEAARTASTAEQKKRNIWLLLEVIAGVNNDQRQPLPERVDVVELPWMLLGAAHHPVGHGSAPAADLQPGPQTDLSKLDPLPSTFWRRPGNIAAADLYHGFGRKNLSGIEKKICAYEGPKDSYGTNPGFEVDSDGVKVKLKFAEVSSEPLTTRMFDALGFHSDETDYAPEAKVRYDRRIFQEFNSRRELKTRFTLFGLTYYTMRLQKKYDPFNYIASAVLRDGRRWSGQELKSQLFRDSKRKHPEDDSANFKPEVEANVDYLVTVAANVQPKNPDIKTIGSWDHGQLDHAGRRELRGAGILAAWLGFFDTRYDNMRVRVVKGAGGEEIVHYFSDLGGGMGHTTGLLFMHGERPNEFPWAFTRPGLSQGPGRMAKPLRIEGYKPIAPTESFAAMTIDDARWMARLIGQLSEEQIVQALVASGYDSAEVRLYTGKLVNRRDRMVRDLGLSAEIPLLRPAGIDRKFSYDPALDGPIIVNLPDGRKEQAPVGNSKVVRGKLVSSNPGAK